MFRCYGDSKTSKTLLSIWTLWRHSSIFFCAFFLHIIHVSMSCQINSCQNIMSDQTCTLRRKCRAWYLLHQIYLQFTLLTGWWPLFFHRWLPLTTNFLHFDEKICMWGLANISPFLLLYVFYFKAYCTLRNDITGKIFFVG